MLAASTIALSQPAVGAGVFNGSNARLTYNSAVATATPIAYSVWFKTTDVTNRGALVALSRTQSGGAPNYFSLEAAGDVDGDPVRAFARVNSTSVGFADTSSGYSSGSWHHVFCVFYSSTSRKVWIDGGSDGDDDSDRTPSSLAATTIGVINERGNFISYFDGKIAEVAVWAGSGVESMGATEAAALAGGVRPNLLPGFTGNLVLYQPLRAGVNEWDKVGPTLTNTNVTFDPSDHPRVIYQARQHYHRTQRQ